MSKDLKDSAKFRHIVYEIQPSSQTPQVVQKGSGTAAIVNAVLASTLVGLVTISIKCHFLDLLNISNHDLRVSYSRVKYYYLQWSSSQY